MEDNEKKLTSQTEGETIEDNDDNQYEHICYVPQAGKQGRKDDHDARWYVPVP